MQCKNWIKNSKKTCSTGETDYLLSKLGPFLYPYGNHCVYSQYFAYSCVIKTISLIFHFSCSLAHLHLLLDHSYANAAKKSILQCSRKVTYPMWFGNHSNDESNSDLPLTLWVFCLSCEIYFYSRPTCVMVWDFTIILHLMLSNIAMSQTFFRSSLWPHSSVVGHKETSCLEKQEASDWRFQVSNRKNFFVGEGLTLLSTEREVFESPSMRHLKDMVMWSGTWLSGGLGSARLTGGLIDLRALF